MPYYLVLEPAEVLDDDVALARDQTERRVARADVPDVHVQRLAGIDRDS